MKQSEMKKQLESQFKNQEYADYPKSYVTIECKHKKLATGGCMLCWHCDACGRRGCDNIHWFRPNVDTWRKIKCDLEEG